MSRREPDWQAALRAGRPRLATFRWLMRRYGGEWSRWQEPETLQDRMVADAVAFAAPHGVAPGPAGTTALLAHRFIVDIIVHLGHWRFGRPRHGGWRKDREKWEVGMDAAQIRIAQVAGLHQGFAAAGGAFVRGQALALREQVRVRAEAGLTPVQIASDLSSPVSTIHDHLKALGLQRPRGRPRSPK